MLVGAIFGWWNVYLITVSFVILPFLPSSIPCWPPGIQWMMMRCWCPGAKATSAPQNNWNTQCAPTHNYCHNRQSSIIIISIVRSDKSSVCCPIPAFSAKKLLRREWIWNLAQALHGENFTRQFLYAKFQILSLCTPQKHVCFAINTIKDNFFLQILLPRGVWIETNSNLLRTSKSWPSKFMKSNQHFILQTKTLCELHELC